ncbi:MAG: M48 family metalloprotease, partial [Deltaproteobacteria bacterium]|nr:M48 family metalloprotease [Deltaproteobacteria bacterium]
QPLIYNNLLYLITVIIIFATGSVPDEPQIPFAAAFIIFILKGVTYQYLVHNAHAGKRVTYDKKYFSVEHKYSLLAIFIFAIDVYVLDIKYYLDFLSLNGHLPALLSLGGIALFFFYLALLWLAARNNYTRIFGRRYSAGEFVINNIKFNLPIVLPWLIINFIVDFLKILPFPLSRMLASSEWGETIIVLLFFILLAFIFPVLIRYLWNCQPLPAGPARTHMEEFCRHQNFTYSDIMLWPLYEGKMLTAGVMGISKKYRYILITPALLEVLTPYEVEAVLAHEIGHVKKYHLQLYLVLFLGFGLVASLIASPLLYLVLNSNIFYRIINFAGIDPEAALAFWGAAPMFVIMLVYFRYVFGFFMRNFERQADLAVFTSLGDSTPLINSLEKISWLSGNIRDKPSWHHFGIGQRVDFLEKCSRDRSLIRRHDRKVYGSLILFIGLLVFSAGIFWNMDMELDSEANIKFVESVLLQRARREPDKAIWHRLLGDLKQDIEQDAEALAAYEKSIALEPENPEVLNNLAWLLITAKEPEVLDPERALELAKNAAFLRPAAGYILDTLAAAYWANDMIDKALDAERTAMKLEPENRTFYRRQMDFFLNNTWPADLESWTKEK